MPSPGEILFGLHEIANRGIVGAIAWHVVLAAAVVALAQGWRPSRRLARIMLAAPIASVAAVALASGNPFTGVVLGVTAIALVALAGDRGPIEPGAAWARGLGAALIAFGWVYPHFLDEPAFAYVLAAPVGLVPCPTLALAIGFALAGGGLGSRAWSLVLAAAGLFYGVFGVLVLGVALDVALVAGAAALAALALLGHARSAGPISWPS